MHRLYILFIILTACNNKQRKTENLTVSKDTASIQRGDSIPQSPNPINALPPVQFKDSIQVNKINQIIAKIDDARIKDSVYLENEEFMKNMTDGGGSLTGYFQNGKLVKIAEWYGLSWGISEVNYYFNNNDLVYVNEKEKEFDYNDSSGIDHSRFGMFFDGNYYFNKGKIFDEISLGHGKLEVSGNDLEKVYTRRAKENKSIILKHKTK